MPLVFEASLSDVTCGSNNTANFTCTLNRTPSQDLEWRKDGQKLRIDGKKYSVVKEDAGLTLSINRISEDDAGLYSVYLNSNTFSSAQLNIERILRNYLLEVVSYLW